MARHNSKKKQKRHLKRSIRRSERSSRLKESDKRPVGQYNNNDQAIGYLETNSQVDERDSKSQSSSTSSSDSIERLEDEVRHGSIGEINSTPEEERRSGIDSPIEVKEPSEACTPAQKKDESEHCKITMVDCNVYNVRPTGERRGSIVAQPAKVSSGYDVPPSRRPIVIVEPNNDSFECDCSYCQFLSGWCCYPIGVIFIILLIAGYIWYRQSRADSESTVLTITQSDSIIENLNKSANKRIIDD